MLHDLDVVDLDIGQLHPEVEAGGLSRAALREELIVNLKQAGLRILPDDGHTGMPDSPQLSLVVNVTPVESFPMYSVFVTLRLRQHACLTRNLIVCEPVVTWEGASDIRTISVSQLTEVQQDVHVLIAHFIDAYVAENPKR
jgi:hypothetical protein